MRALTFLLLLLVPLLLAQRRLPDIGELMYQSRDYQVNTCIREGGILIYDDSTHLFSCTTSGSISGSIVRVTLAAGTRTVLSDTRIAANSGVACGCLLPADQDGPSCNTEASWLARMRVAEITTGSAVLVHAYAIGNEEVSCLVTGLAATPTPAP